MEQAMGYRPERLGIGTPGTLDPRLGTMKGCNSECMNGQPMKKDLEKLLQMDVAIANDANEEVFLDAMEGRREPREAGIVRRLGYPTSFAVTWLECNDLSRSAGHE